jgi:trimethylamine--corrinoid protein Co-methyltransferase
LLPALAGANLIYGLGMIEMGMTFDFGQLVLDNEVARMVKHTVNGIPVNDETLAVDVIKEIGIGKDFLSHDSTYRHMRSLSAPMIFDRKMREDWEQAGRNDIYAKATEKAREILETHKPEPLPEEVRKKIRLIVENAEAELGISK